MVISATTEKRPDSDLTASLLDLDIDPSDVPSVIGTVRQGFRSGVQFAVMGAPAPQLDQTDELFCHAYDRGRASMRYTSPFWVLIRFVGPILIGAGLVGFILWKFVF